MKNFFITAGLLTILCSCDAFEYNLSIGFPRGRTSVRLPSHGSDSGSFRAELPPDTLLFFSAVEILDGYNWQRDTACRAPEAAVVLFKDYERIVTVPTGDRVSAEHDMHHILDGHLYTEYSSNSETIIGRDGQELFRFPGREFLKGLLIRGDDVYSLSQHRSGEGFSLRKNGESVMRRETGYIFGDMSDPSYGPTGALYEDNGKYCFCYWVYAGDGKEYFRVDNGQDARIPGPDQTNPPMDIKLSSGNAVISRRQDYGYWWDTARIWTGDGNIQISGELGYNEYVDKTSGLYDTGRGARRILPVGNAHFYLGEGSYAAVHCSREGSVSVYAEDFSGVLEGSFYFFSANCATMRGKSPVLALTPKGKDGHPVIWADGEAREIELNGFLTGVQVMVSPPN